MISRKQILKIEGKRAIQMRDINQRILELWQTTSKEYLNGLMPMLIDNPNSNQVTFIGLNPSFSVDGFKTFLQKTDDYCDINVREFYAFPLTASFSKERSMEIEKLMKEKYPYFNPFGYLLKDTGEKWEYLDLFYIRETSQEKLKQVIFSKDGKLSVFAQEQLKITKDILEEIQPKVIVIVNALASRIFKGEEFKTPFAAQFNEQFGCYSTEIGGRTIPVFLSSMLSGQRALDIFSKERLRWHLQKVLKDIASF